MYSLHAPLWKTNDTLRKLLKEVMGYSDNEIKILEKEQFCRNIAKNLTIDQAKKITEIFADNDFGLYLHDSNNKTLYWLKDLNIDLEENPPKDHYCDEPLMSANNRVDVNVSEPVRPYVQTKASPKIECPYCHSTNTKKITVTSKVAHTALFGIFSISRNSKQWHCNSCGSDF